MMSRSGGESASISADGTRDGSVHRLYVVTGITTDPTIPNCAITQPNFAAQLAAGNLSYITRLSSGN
jgi:hypothetical protein